MRRMCAFAVAAVLFIPAASYARKDKTADNPAGGHRELVKKEKKLEDVERRIRENKENISEASKKETDILGEVERINKAVKGHRDELKAVGASIKGIEGKIERSSANAARLAEERKRIKARLDDRLRAMYRMKDGAAVKAVFSAADSSEMAVRYRQLTAIMEADAKLMDSAEKNLAEIKEEEARLMALKAELYVQKKEAEERKNAAEADIKGKKTLLASVKKAKGDYVRMSSELDSAKKGLMALIEKLKEAEKEGGKDAGEEDDSAAASGFAAMKGKLKMPASGKVVSNYGKVVHPKFQTVTFNNGIIIDAPYGAEVRSVYEGSVLYVGWLKGYGQVLIVDNGGGYYTLFAHLSEIFKKKGEAAARGEAVGKVGDSGPEESSGLYFEIRQKGVPKDPMAWLDGR